MNEFPSKWWTISSINWAAEKVNRHNRRSQQTHK